MAESPDPKNLRRFYTLEEMVELLRSSKTTIRRMIAMGKMKGVRPVDPFGTSRLLFPREEVDAWLKRRQQATTKEYDPSIYLK